MNYFVSPVSGIRHWLVKIQNSKKARVKSNRVPFLVHGTSPPVFHAVSTHQLREPHLALAMILRKHVVL